MARLGVLGDIHGNLEALDAVLAASDRLGVERLLCVGDIVGYNADSNACIARLRARDAVAIAGNHDLIGIRQLGVERCSDKAAYALLRTRVRLNADSAAYLATLPQRRLVDGRIALIHAGVDDVQQYVRTPSQVRENAARLREVYPTAEICFLGHTHAQCVFADNSIDARAVDTHGAQTLARGPLYFINAGSVDAARKPETDKQAQFALFDSMSDTVEFHSVAYDHETTEAKARAAGYRMEPATAWAYALRRRVRNRLRRELAASPRVRRLLAR